MYIFGESFDFYATMADAMASYWDAYPQFISSGGNVYAPGRFGGQGCRSTYNTGMIKASNANDPVHHITVALMSLSPTTDTYPGFVFTFLDGTTAQCSIHTGRNGTLYLCSGNYGGTILDSFAGAFPVINQWVAFEIEVVIHNTTGSWTIRKNGNTGTPDRTLGGLNTRGGTANNYANKLQFGVNNPTGNDAAQVVDDLIWRSGDASGVLPNGVPWLGDIRCYTRMPVSDQSVQFTPTGSRSVVFGAVSGLGVVGNRAWYGPFTPVSTSNISTVTFQSGPLTGNNLKCAIFTDNAGVPGNLVGTATAPLVAPSSGANFTFSPPVLVTGGVKYHVGFCTSGGGGSLAGGSPYDGYFSDATPYASWPPSTVSGLTGGSTRAVGSTIFMAPTTNAGATADPQQDGLATYVSDSTPGHADFYGIAARSSPAPPVTTNFVTTRGFMRKADAGSRFAAVQVKSGATVAQSTPTNPDAGSFSWVYRTDRIDPNTGAAWAPSAVDALQVGPVIVS
jgi:hypothetical protein